MCRLGFERRFNAKRLGMLFSINETGLIYCRISGIIRLFPAIFFAPKSFPAKISGQGALFPVEPVISAMYWNVRMLTPRKSQHEKPESIAHVHAMRMHAFMHKMHSWKK